MDVLHRSRHRPRTARERCPGAARPTRTCIPRATVCGAVRPPREAAPALSRAAHQPAEARGGLIDERRERVDEPKHIPRADPRLRWGAGVSAAAPRTEAFPSHFVHLPRSAFTPTHPLLLPLPVALPYSLMSDFTRCVSKSCRPARGGHLRAVRVPRLVVGGVGHELRVEPAAARARRRLACGLARAAERAADPSLRSDRLGIAHGARQPRGRNRRS